VDLDSILWTHVRVTTFRFHAGVSGGGNLERGASPFKDT
jgi:hypothetical protein